MVNIPHRSSEALMAEAIAPRLSAIRRRAGAIVLALVAAAVLAVLLQDAEIDSKDFVPLDDPAVTWLFTA